MISEEMVMRKNKLLLCIALILVFAMTLTMFVACGDDDKQVVTPPAGDTAEDGDQAGETPDADKPAGGETRTILSSTIPLTMTRRGI